MTFRFITAYSKEWDAARIHSGLLAQQVQEAFASEGLDASAYGLFCHDQWEERPEELSPDGEMLREAVPAGDRYGIRYSEALALECAYQRWLGEKREQRIAALEAKLEEIKF